MSKFRNLENENLKDIKKKNIDEVRLKYESFLKLENFFVKKDILEKELASFRINFQKEFNQFHLKINEDYSLIKNDFHKIQKKLSKDGKKNRKEIFKISKKIDDDYEINKNALYHLNSKLDENNQIIINKIYAYYDEIHKEFDENNQQLNKLILKNYSELKNEVNEIKSCFKREKQVLYIFFTTTVLSLIVVAILRPYIFF